MNKEYYVYHVSLGEDIIYVGKGTGKRYLHAVSGASHNSALNEVWFRYVLLGEAKPRVTIVKYFDSEKAAFTKENEDIMKLAPIYNNTIGHDHTPLNMTVPDFIDYVKGHELERRKLKTKLYYCTCEDDRLLLSDAITLLEDRRENNGGHNIGFAGKHFKGDSAGKKAYGRFKNKFIKDKEREPTEEESLSWLETRNNKRKNK